MDCTFKPLKTASAEDPKHPVETRRELNQAGRHTFYELVATSLTDESTTNRATLHMLAGKFGKDVAAEILSHMSPRKFKFNPLGSLRRNTPYTFIGKEFGLIAETSQQGDITVDITQPIYFLEKYLARLQADTKRNQDSCWVKWFRVSSEPHYIDPHSKKRKREALGSPSTCL